MIVGHGRSAHAPPNKPLDGDVARDAEVMGTRRWVAELEAWMQRSNLSHSVPHVLALFRDPNPNPTLGPFLDLMQVAGARFHGPVR